jgi:hypothetical protein
VVNGERASDPRGQVVITRFECPSRLRLLVILAMHYRVKKEVRRVAEGYLGGTTIVQWKQRTLLSLSLWRQLDSIYDMGKANRHIVASRVPARLRVSTACGIYAYSGDWRQLMFGTPVAANEPLLATGTTLTESERNSS